jgi:hypothetical protein
MRNGRRWLALDADFLSNPFTIRLLEQFGAAGVVTWVAFLCACKRSPTPGVFVYTHEAQALVELGIFHLQLRGGAVDKWTLDDFWRFTGQQKQTRMTRVIHRKHVTCSHWGRWQQDARRQDEAERKSRSRGRNRRDIPRTSNGHDADTTRTMSHQTGQEKEKETPLPPKGAEVASQREPNFKSLGQAVGELKAKTPKLRGGTP